MKKILFLVLFLCVLPCFAEQYKVLRVIDGDTIDIDYQGKRERIRLLNVDTPESVHPDRTRNTRMGKQASDYTKKRLSGKYISLEFDGDKRGKYGRLLAYVGLDKNNFNLELVQKGWSVTPNTEKAKNTMTSLSWPKPCPAQGGAYLVLTLEEPTAVSFDLNYIDMAKIIFLCLIWGKI